MICSHTWRWSQACFADTSASNSKDVGRQQRERDASGIWGGRDQARGLRMLWRQGRNNKADSSGATTEAQGGADLVSRTSPRVGPVGTRTVECRGRQMAPSRG